MASEKFTLDDSMSAGWNLLKAKFWKFLGLIALAGFLSILPDLGSAGTGLNDQLMLFTVLLSVAGLLMKGLMALGVTNIQIRMVNDLPCSSADLWTPAGKFFAYVGATMIYAIVVAAGFLCFIVPGIIMAITWQFYAYFLVEHRLGPIASLKASTAITKGVKWELFFLGLILSIIEGIAPLAFLVGAIPAHIFSKLTMAHVYKTLLESTPPEDLPFPYESPRIRRRTQGFEGGDYKAELGGHPSGMPPSLQSNDGGRLPMPGQTEHNQVDNNPHQNDKSGEEF